MKPKELHNMHMLQPQVVCFWLHHLTAAAPHCLLIWKMHLNL